MKNQKFIFTKTKTDSSVGVYDNGEYQMIVEVCRLRQGSNTFIFKVDGSSSHKITSNSAKTSWEDVESYLAAPAVVVDKKYLMTHYSEILKPYEEEAKRLRAEAKVRKHEKEVAIDDEEFVAKESLFDNNEYMK